ncbi:MAG: WD40/YVTN/BNR-like repeat-containing protein [Myxococcaceae bacterium]
MSLPLLAGCAGEADWVMETSATGGAGAGNTSVRLGAWRSQMTGLPQGEVLGVAHLDGAVFVLVKGNGIFSLRDGAQGWAAANPTLSSSSELITALSVVGNALFAATSDGSTGNLYRLKFADDPWQRLSGAPSAPMTAIVKKGSAILVAAVGGLYASTDGGNTFTRRCDSTKAPLFSRPVRSFAAAAASQRMFATGELSTGFGGLYASDDEGATWQKLPLEGDVEALSANGAVVLASMSQQGELRSDNYGNTFHPVDVNGPSRAFFLAGTKGFAGSAGTVMVSDDAGLSWRDPQTRLPTSADVGTVYLAGKTLVAVAGGTVYLNDLQ